LSSTTRSLDLPASPLRSRRQDRERGQILVLFVGGLVAFLAIAALVFDVGQNLFDWRTQRNAADAAALAGSRYIAEPGCLAAPSIAACTTAYQAAIHVAALNGYGDVDGDGIDDRGHVDVHIPAIASGSSYAGLPGFLEVDIHTDRPSFFAAVLGMLQQNVDAMAIAGNSNDVIPPYSMLALNPDCDPNPSGQVGGNGDVTVGGSVVVNSNCDGALLVNGNGSLIAPECDVVGTAQESGSNANLDCPVLPFDGTTDPLAYINSGSMPGTPAPVEILSWPNGTASIPAGCPGSTVAISAVGTAFAASNSVALPAFTGGDLALVFAYRGSNAAPGVPSGWQTVVSDNGADSNSRSIGYRVLDGTELDTGTWANANAIEVIILRGQDADTPIGVHASGGSAGTTMTTPGLSGMGTSGHSWVVAFAGANSGANATTLSGTTNRNGTVSSLGLATGENRTTWTSQAYTGSVVGPNRTDAVEILPNPNPSTAANPAGCTFSGGGGGGPGGAGTYHIFRIHPGTYFGGLKFNGTVRVYMAPGTYWLAGGGFSIGGKGAQIISVDGSSSTTPGRGVFIYDTEDAVYHDQCVAGTAPAGACIGDIKANGGSDDLCTYPPDPSLGAPYTPNPPALKCAWLHLEPTDSPIKNLLIFVDRSLTANITFNGSTGKIDLSGTIYDPNGDVSINGSADDAVSAQIIANTFSITGNGGFTVTYDANGIVHLSGVGLVQ
jgi:hypothetical protein